MAMDLLGSVYVSLIDVPCPDCETVITAIVSRPHPCEGGYSALKHGAGRMEGGHAMMAAYFHMHREPNGDMTPLWPHRYSEQGVPWSHLSGATPLEGEEF